MIPGLLIVLILVLVTQALMARFNKVMTLARHTKRPLTGSLLGLLGWGCPLFVTGDYNKIVGTTAINGLAQDPQVTLPAPRPGFVYNRITMIDAGTVTAVAGAAAGNGAADIVNLVNMESDKKGILIDNVRWYALWILGYSIDGFTPIAATSAGAGGGAYRSSVTVPVVITESETVRITFTTVAAHATYHTTATAFAGTITILVDEVPAGGNQTNRKCLAYSERHVDVLGIATPLQFAPRVLPDKQLYKIGIYTQDTARGTLANDINTVNLTIGGRLVLPPNTLFLTLAELTASLYRRAIVTGVAFIDFKPTNNTAADQLTLLNGATATVALSGVLLCYVEA